MEKDMTISLVVVGLYLLLYTAFDKGSRTIKPQLLFEVLFVQKSINYTILQLNKVFALAGLTLLGMPYFECIWQATLLLWAHWGISIWKFYGKSNIPPADRFLAIPSDIMKNRNRTETIKKLSVISGAIGQLFLLSHLHLLPTFGLARVLMFSLIFGVLHFYMMEIDASFKLQVRPAGLAAFAVPILTIFLMIVKSPQ